MADKYIFSNISLFSLTHRVYLYGADGTCEELCAGTSAELPALIAKECFNHNITYVRIHGHKLFVNPIAKSIEKEIDKKNCEFCQNIKVKVKVVVD